MALQSPCSLCYRPPSSTPATKIGAGKSSFFFSGNIAVAFPAGGGGGRRMDARNAKTVDLRPRASVAAGTVSRSTEVAKGEVTSNDANLVFVAGATGRVGSRTVRELLKLGFRVRAGVRSAQSQKAQKLVQVAQEMKLDNVAGSSDTQPVERLELVECDLEKQGDIVPAIGGSSVVICCIGASEKEILDITGPYRIDYQATKNLIDSASIAQVDHFILLTSLGTNKVGFPAAILNLFWGVLVWKRKAEEALISSGLPYTIVRPGGMERPTDAFKETHNVLLANEDTRFGGLVSNLQVAELLACMAKNRRLSYCKVVEVVAETTAPLTPMEELLARIPSKRELPPELKQEPAVEDSKPAMSVTQEKTLEKDVKMPRPLSPYTMYDDLKPPSSPSPTPSTTPGSLKEMQLESTQAKAALTPMPVATETSQAPVGKTKPLSRYPAYEDLKPPNSPSPTPSTIPSRLEEIQVESVQTKQELERTFMSTETIQSPSVQTRPLSPYTAYEDLKPPTSPTPTPSTSHSAIKEIQADTTNVMTDGIQAPGRKIRPLSPYTAYEGLKPPTSPTPIPSSGSPSAAILESNSGNGAAIASGNKVNEIQANLRPLSPYTMYEELKPPSSPVPSVPK